MIEDETIGADPICFNCNEAITDKEYSSMQVKTGDRECFYVFHNRCFFECMENYLLSQEVPIREIRVAN